jgi:hypothetical protein
MEQKFIQFFIGLLLLCFLCAAVPAADDSVMQGVMDWQRVLGGSSSDYGHAIRETSDGGYILTGYTYSSSNGDVGANHGAYDVWVVKLNSAGTISWQKVLGGSGSDYGYDIRQTADGGYILIGETTSSASGDVTGTNHGGVDLWIVKLSSAGAVTWQKLLGGSGNDFAAEIQSNHGNLIHQTSDGGYILTGYTSSSANGDVTAANHGSYDAWVVKMNPAGSIEWNLLLGGSNSDYGFGIQQTGDGGYILIGPTFSSASGDVTGTNHGGDDIWVVKLNAAGTVAWQRLLGGIYYDYASSILQTSDGGYVLAGGSQSSNDGDVWNSNHGDWDVWVVKLTSSGSMTWQNLLGGSRYEIARSIRQTSDGGYILIGPTFSSASGDVTGTNHGGQDIWVMKLTSGGTLAWQKVMGGSSSEDGLSIQQTSDGSYILVGNTVSSSTGDVGANHGNTDVWVVKLHETPVIRLSPGWNFISTPKVLLSGSDTAGVVFSGVNTDGHSIFLYNASTKVWTPMTASSKVKVLDGIWIYSKVAAAVSLNPDPNPILVPAAKPVFTEWNAIGFSALEPAYARDALSSVSAKWSTAIGFDAQNQRYETAIIRGGSGIYSDYRNMEPTKGYWLYMAEAGTLGAIGA